MRYALTVLVLFVFTATAAGQALGPTTQIPGNPTAYYRHVESGDITVEVNVWGAVHNPGLYEVAKGTHLNTLLTLAGGPPIGVTTVGGASRVNHTLRLRLLRTTGGSPQVVFETTMKDGILLSQDNPVVDQGDYLIVEVTEHQAMPFTWRDGLTVTTAIAAVVLVVERVVNMF